MSNFIPANQQAAESFSARLSKTFFRDPDTFVAMFNSGMIARKNPEVTALVDDLVSAFKGIEQKGDKITFLDPAEIATDELITYASALRVLLQLKRVAKTAIEEGTIEAGTTLAFEESRGLLLADGDAISSERTRIPADQVTLVSRMLRVQDITSSEFPAQQLLAVDGRSADSALRALTGQG